MQKEDFNTDQCKKYVQEQFDSNIFPSLKEYIEIPNLSRAYDDTPEGYKLLEQAAEHIEAWVKGFGIKGLTTEIMKEKNEEGLLLCPIIFT